MCVQHVNWGFGRCAMFDLARAGATWLLGLARTVRVVMQVRYCTNTLVWYCTVLSHLRSPWPIWTAAAADFRGGRRDPPSGNRRL